jgi:hypothetical protein
MIRKFRCEVTQIHELDIEIDDEKFTQKEMDEFVESFYPDVKTYENHAAMLASLIFNGETDGFIEGYGDVKRYGEFVHDFSKDKKVDSGFNIIGNRENVSWRDVEVVEITPISKGSNA